MHVRNANALIERMAEEGRRLFGDKPDQNRKWQNGWKDVKQHISRLGQVTDTDLATALREFIHSFEHQTRRMYQMMFGLADSPNTDSDTPMNVTQLRSWIDLTYRASTYAIISIYIPDKQETGTLRMAVNLRTGKTTTERERTKAKLPRKYRNTTKGI